LCSSLFITNTVLFPYFHRGFKRAAGQHIPQHTIAYYHAHFQRGKADLLKNMSGGKKKDSGLHDKMLAKQLNRDVQAVSSLSHPHQLGHQQAPLGLGGHHHHQLAQFGAGAYGLQQAAANNFILPGGGNYLNPSSQSMLGQQQAQPNAYDQELRLQALMQEQQTNDLIRQQQQHHHNQQAAQAHAQAQAQQAQQQAQLYAAMSEPSPAAGGNDLRRFLMNQGGGGGPASSAPGGDGYGRMLLSAPQPATMQSMQMPTGAPNAGQPMDQNLLQLLLAQKRQQEQQYGTM
jgi:hypothetical protein